ncbi:hypothetical protein M501DRAFT_991397 [Patellaria atrata CBS 101060]|uniref:DNA-directed RNA polymerase III subunit RPC3 n=1 Tax=Patellaria atrata CBS 101060 TaxID=1346257 RepID=A0A9P4SF01_9PEZI|nr:hypothetical protein M501DRAFT_991397 [Patellaria atrata CBS 101060]
MAQHIAELCTLLVDDLYGNLSSRVFATLVRVGRLTLGNVAHHSGLSARQVKHGLVVLIQQHLVLHSTQDSVTHYEANVQQAYALVRSGKIIKLVEDRFGEAAGGIVSNLLLLGHARVKDLAEAYGVSKKHGLNGAQVNGNASLNTEEKEKERTGSQHFKTLGQLHKELGRLLNEGFLKEVWPVQFKPEADVQTEAELIVTRDQYKGGVKGTKQTVQFNEDVRALKRKWRDEGADEDRANGQANGTKPARPVSKRVKINKYAMNGMSGHANDDDDLVGSLLDEELIVRVNIDRCNVAFRSQQLVEFCSRYISESTAMVYEALLQRLETKIERCHDLLVIVKDEIEERETAPLVTLLEVSNALDKNVDLAAGLWSGNDNQTSSAGSNGNKTNNYEDEGYVEEEDSFQVNGSHRADQLTARDKMIHIKSHLQLLCDDPRRFVTWVGSRGGGEYRVNFRALTSSLIQYELEKSVTARFGALATRLVRALHTKGKLDEKQACNICLVKQKDIRVHFAALQEAGYVDTQEIPKDNSRQPSRTIYLWSFDQSRCRELVLHDTYKAMCKLLHRMKVERRRYKAVIDKAERTDVIGNEDRYLTGMEKQTLSQWRDSEEKLLTQLSRQDELVTLFRDFPMPPFEP